MVLPGEQDVTCLEGGHARVMHAGRTQEPSRSRRMLRKQLVVLPFGQGLIGFAVSLNNSFRPFQSPVPFLFVRNGVISDWKFFLDNDEWLELWARRYEQSAVQALAAELRRTNWKQLG